MLDIKTIRENPELIKTNNRQRLVEVDVDRLLQLDEEIRELKAGIDQKRAERNSFSKTKPSAEIITAMKQLGEELKKEEVSLADKQVEFRKIMITIPNLTHPEVKVSADETDNPVLEISGEPTKFSFPPKDHVELGQELDLIDLERAAKVTGAKFYYLKNELALLEFALIQYALDILVQKGFTIFTTPDLAKREVLEGLGFNPRGESTQVYNLENSDLSLIGTAEITLGGYHQNEVLLASELPKRYAAVSHCFRTEAGSYSKFAKGIFRVHQFTKVEMFQYVKPELAESAHQELLAIEKEIFQGLEIPFRVVDHCTADLGTPARRTFDLEAWLPGKPAADGSQGDWAEVTSTSDCGDYQARALNIKYQDEAGNKHLVNTLNGTAIAITRCLIAIMENNQQADGSIKIPSILQKYLVGGLQEIKPKLK